MKRLIFGVTLVILGTAQAFGQSGMSGTGSNPNSHSVSPYTKSNGTFVQGSHATNPNTTQRDNFGTRGNVNPFNGKTGTRGALR
jgi:hypothetical protein